MDLKMLEYLLEIDRSGSINKAAQKLYIAQSSLSQSVKSLEKELGFTIFFRKTTGISLTPSGKLLLKSAKIILQEIQSIQNIPQLLAQNAGLSVTSTWSYLFMSLFMQFKELHHGDVIKDKFKETGFQQVLQDLIDKTYRLGLISCLKEQQQAHGELLRKYDLTMDPLCADIPSVALVSRDHPLSSLPHITPAQLKKWPIVVYDMMHNDQWLRSFSISPSQNDILNIYDRGSMLDAIDHKYIALVMWDPTLEKSLHRAVAIPIPQGPQSTLYSIRRESYQLNRREQIFLDFVKGQIVSLYRR